MHKKLFILSLVFLLSFLLLNTSAFANNTVQNMTNNVRNAVGNAENSVEGAVKDMTNTSKNITNDMTNTANTMTNNAKNTLNTSNGYTNTYNATRTEATGNATFMGMNSTAWTWLIIGVAAIVIIALVWYYSMRVNNSNYNTRD